MTITPRRIQLSRKKGFRLPPNTVSVARPSRWGNPYALEWDADNRAWEVASEDERILCVYADKKAAAGIAVEMFERHVKELPDLDAMLAPLRGKNLACWCPLYQPCHAEILLELANKEPAQ